MVIRALHFLLLPIAATFGWYFGKKDNTRRDYLRGLNYLISEQSDKAVDVFIKLSEVDSNTVEIHLALGNLFRRRGEVDRAIRIHQNLLDRTELDKRYHLQALFALGQDFLKAGVLDRAEKIFLQLADAKEGWVEEKQSSLRFLLRIYQQEKEWGKAVEVAQQLAEETEEKMDKLLAQLYCELAEQEAGRGRPDDAFKQLQQAIHADANCVRANFIAGRLATEGNTPLKAILYYQQVKQQNIHYIPDIVAPLENCYKMIGEEKKYIDFLQECLEDYPSIALLMVIVEYLQKTISPGAGIEYLRDQLQIETAKKIMVNRLVFLYLINSQDSPEEKLALLKNIIHELTMNKANYRCTHCGFLTRSLLWNCPGCQNWSSIRAIKL
jgi:lipopolysaccharide biosynthesis regulator YciM